LYPLSICNVAADAVILIEPCVRELKKFAYAAMWPALAKDILKQICPNVQDDPFLIIQGIHMESRDSSGEVVTLTLGQYFKAISSMTQLLSKTLPWLIDVVQHHDMHLTEGLRNQIKSNGYAYNPTTATRLPWDQTRDLSRAYSASSQAERDINLCKEEITSQLKSNHALMTTVSVHQSQAESTIHRYQPKKCWGYKDESNSFGDRRGNVLCLNADKPEVMKRAKEKRAEYQAKNLRKNQQRAKKRKVTSILAGLNDEQVKALITSVKNQSMASEEDSSKVWTFLMCVCVFF